MPVIIEGKSANELFVKIAREMIKNGHENDPRGLKTLEISDAWLILTDPKNSTVTLLSRDINYRYLQGEMLWYKSGSLFMKDIVKFSEFWRHLADPNGTVNSNYGFIVNVEKWNGISQFGWCVKKLLADINTRQAIINYNMPRYKYEGNKDFVCTISQQFLFRKGKLDCITLMRSNDLIYGLTYDLLWFTELQIKLAEILNVPLGLYNHYDASLHVYERHFEMIKKIAEEKI
jgi:thymidylate synthase